MSSNKEIKEIRKEKIRKLREEVDAFTEDLKRLKMEMDNVWDKRINAKDERKIENHFKELKNIMNSNKDVLSSDKYFISEKAEILLDKFETKFKEILNMLDDREMEKKVTNVLTKIQKWKVEKKIRRSDVEKLLKIQQMLLDDIELRRMNVGDEMKKSLERNVKKIEKIPIVDKSLNSVQERVIQKSYDMLFNVFKDYGLAKESDSPYYRGPFNKPNKDRSYLVQKQVRFAPEHNSGGKFRKTYDKFF